jgi:hypothetical protein
VYAHVVRGEVTANGQALAAGDAMKLDGNENRLRLEKAQDAEVLVFDLPA